MRVLVGCEESQAVTIELRKLGHEAFSCDLKESSGGCPQWHYKRDIFEVIEFGWDMAIFFPPCTNLAVSGSMHFKEKILNGSQQKSIDFFMALVNAPINKIAIENPIGIMSSVYRKPDQIIQPYFFGDEAQKSTCLWLKNLPPLLHNDKPNLFEPEATHVGKGQFHTWTTKKGKTKTMPLWYYEAFMNSKSPEERATLRSKTFKGIAQQMALQWTKEI
jgi:hypothetical protein